MLKVEPASSYPPEEGRYLRGNDYSPVAVAVILIYDQERIPADIQNLVRVGLESGAALSGTIQTENIGIEKLICNVVANPNIRHLVIFGPESPGHQTGEALIKLIENGVDERKRIIGAHARTPYLFNLPIEYIARFRQAVWSCFQEEPTAFQNYTLFDPGAYPGAPLSGQLTWRVTRPQAEPKDEAEREQREKLRALMVRVKRGAQKKREGERP
jgi:tetrahydromethanopterin S-methyltransferase subunit A